MGAGTVTECYRNLGIAHPVTAVDHPDGSRSLHRDRQRRIHWQPFGPGTTSLPDEGSWLAWKRRRRVNPCVRTRGNASFSSSFLYAQKSSEPASDSVVRAHAPESSHGREQKC